MLVAFIILLGLWFGHQSLTKLESATGTGGITITGDEKEEFDKLRIRLPELERALVALRKENAQLRADIQANENALAKAKGQIDALNNKPPIISLPETSGYKFTSGTADLTEEFSTLLAKAVFADIRKVLDRGDVNTIEIIGHTDGQSVRRRVTSNLDAQLGYVLSAQQPAEALRFGSNADLGLVRAVAVRRKIEAWLSGQGLSGRIQVRCYSAANSVPLTDKLDESGVFAGEEAARRRIEIRFTQLDRVPQR